MSVELISVLIVVTQMKVLCTALNQKPTIPANLASTELL